MVPSRHTATSTLTANLYAAIARELQEAALARWSTSPDVFVWRARRCAEAVLYCILAREGANVDDLARQRKSLDQLFEHKQLEGALSRETRAQLSALREFGNIAAHFQLRGGVSEESADGVARHLAGLLREFYALDAGCIPEALRPYVMALTERAARVRTSEEHMLATLNSELASVNSELASVKAQLAQAGMKAPLVRTHAWDNAHAPPTSPWKTRWLVGVGFGAALLGAALTFVFMNSMHEASPAQRDVVHSSPREPSAPQPAPRRSPIVANPSPSEPLDEPRPPFPPTVGTPQPPSDASLRTDTPRSPPRCTPEQRLVRGTSPFCIDDAPILTGRYRECVNVGACPRPIHGDGSNWENRRNDLPINYVSLDAARSYCAWRGGELPTREDWMQARLRTLLDTSEWIEQSPSQSRNVVHAPQGVPTWSARDSRSGARDLSFRCVRR